MREHDLVDLTIDRPVAGGRMLARLDGQVVLVSGTMPGERVRARIIRAPRGVWQAEVVEIPTDTPGGYRTAVDEFLTDLQSTLEGIDEHVQDIDAPELDMPLDEASACQG